MAGLKPIVGEIKSQDLNDNFSYINQKAEEAGGVSQEDFDAHLAEKTSQDNVHGLRESTVSLGSSSAVANDSSGVAVGNNATVNHTQTSGSIAIGLDSKANSGRSIALGRGSNTNGDISIAIGLDAQTSSVRGIAIGRTAVGGNIALALGDGSSATGESSSAIGRGATALNIREGVLGGVGASATNSWIVPGNFTVNGTKNFEIPHPHPNKKDTHRIRHGAVESPTEGDTLYRYTIEATEDNQIVAIQLPDYFKYLNKNVDVWTNGYKHFGRAFGEVEGDILKVTCELAGKYKVLVIGTRNDENVQDWSIKGVEREIGESWLGETYVFADNEIISEEEEF